MWPLPADGFPNEHRPRPSTSQEAAAAWRVRSRLHEDPSLPDEGITVRVQNRVAVLHGTVPSVQAHDRAGRLARDVGDIDDVCNGLRITGRQPGTEPDASAPDPFDDIVRHLTEDELVTPRATPRVSTAAMALCILLATLGALLLTPHDHGPAFAAVAGVLTAAGVLGLLRSRPGSARDRE